MKDLSTEEEVYLPEILKSNYRNFIKLQFSKVFQVVSFNILRVKNSSRLRLRTVHFRVYF